MTTGRYDSERGDTSIEWAMPEYSRAGELLCAVGMHIATRKRVVWGHVGYSPVERHYCACGRNCWVKYEGRFASHDVTESGGHLEWIEGKVEMDRTMSLHRKWERLMSEAHPCWGKSHSCISCGCGVDTPCESHRSGRRPTPVAEGKSAELAAARAALWPQEADRAAS